MLSRVYIFSYYQNMSQADTRKLSFKNTEDLKLLPRNPSAPPDPGSPGIPGGPKIPKEQRTQNVSVKVQKDY
jgi:hypothetical protein